MGIPRGCNEWMGWIEVEGRRGSVCSILTGQSELVGARVWDFKTPGKGGMLTPYLRSHNVG